MKIKHQSNTQSKCPFDSVAFRQTNAIIKWFNYDKKISYNLIN